MVFASLLQFEKYPILQVYATGDAINWLAIYQYRSGAWVLVVNYTTSGGSTRVEDNQPTKFLFYIKFDDDYASSQAQAISYTRVYMNITDGGTIWSNEEMTNINCTGPTGGFYWLYEQKIWNTTGQPVAGVTYSCSAKYQGYY